MCVMCSFMSDLTWCHLSVCFSHTVCVSDVLTDPDRDSDTYQHTYTQHTVTRVDLRVASTKSAVQSLSLALTVVSYS